MKIGVEAVEYSDYENLALSEYKKGRKRGEIIDYLMDMECTRNLAEEITHKVFIEQSPGLRQQKRKVLRVQEDEMEMD